MLVCGYNRYLQLAKTSTNKDSTGNPIIDHPCKFHLNPSFLSSFSTNFGQTVWITGDFKSYVTGNNSDGRISGSLPRKILPNETKLFLKDEEGQPFKFISVVCGQSYTLYLVSTESILSNFKLVYCCSDKTPNPLFVNIGNRTPRALFGGFSTSGVIDTEGGIIVLTSSVFISPTKEVEASFLPGGDKPVKLACCNSFVIALGVSGRVYESEISSIRLNKFEEVKDLSDSIVVDVSGSNDSCFLVLNDGRVFGRGLNFNCKLGLPKETKSVSKFTLIESLKSYKIVSVFTGSCHSIFKTSTNKMIACGSNDRGQLFFPRKNNDIVYPPEEVKKCKGFTFCVTGSFSSVAFFNIEMPQNFSNKIIEEVVIKVKEKDENHEIEGLLKKIKEKEDEISKWKTQTKEYENRLKINDDEISKWKTQTKEYENRLKIIEKENSELKEMSTQIEEENKLLKESSSQIQQENSKLKEELLQLKDKMNKNPEDSQKTQLMKEFEILDADTIKGLENIEEISSNNNSKIIKVAKKVIYALKVLKNEDITHKQLQHFVAEYEIMNALNHPNILKTYGVFYGNEEMPASILLEYCPYNLDKAIKNKTLSRVERVCSIYEISSGMKFVHFNHIIHRDIKPSNILISKDGHMKISDFGISKLVSSDDESMTSGIGTQKFMAPEIINEEEYDEKVDIYSFGVLIYFIISNGNMPKITITQVGIGKKAEIPSDFTNFSKELIDSCWNFKPENRPSFESINAQLKSNAHQLLDLTQSEIKEVNIFIENHQQMIPKC